MLPTFRFIAALALTLLPACDLLVPGSGTNDSDPETVRDDTPPPLPPCQENADCRGGELCVTGPEGDTGVCREVCSVDDDCGDAFYATCDGSAGFCVECVGDDDCGDAEACIDQLCAFFCRKDDDCGRGEFCDERSGECLERECADDDDCSGGFACDDFRCVSILPIVCTADAVRCVDGGVETCNGDGTDASVAACDDGEACVDDDDDGARCAAVVCVPDEIGCEDDGAAFVCDGSGTQRTRLPCRSDQYCATGVCRAQLCAPATATCAGDARVVCDERGAATAVEPCAAEDRCADSAFGCACRASGDDATCVARVCAPGTGQCVGNGARVCNDDGSGFSTVTDCGADACVLGRCLPASCTAGATFCSGDALLTCEANGGGYRTTDCPGTCAGSDGAAACVARVCEPGSVRCAADGAAVLVCNQRGTAETSTACDDGFCAGGTCQARVCEPGTSRCASDTSALACDALGSAEELVRCGAGETPCINGQCDETPLTQGQQCTTGNTARVCGANLGCNAAAGQNGTCEVFTKATRVSQLTDSDQTWNRPNATCTATGTQPRPFEEFEVVNPGAAPVTVSVFQSAVGSDDPVFGSCPRDLFLHVFANRVGANAVAGCTEGNDDGGPSTCGLVDEITIPAGGRVFIVSSTFAAATAPFIIDYQMNAQGFGAFTLNPL